MNIIKKTILLTFFYFINCLLLFASGSNIIKNTDRYKIFTDNFQQLNIVNSFKVTPKNEVFLKSENITGVYIHPQLIDNKQKVLITGYKISENTQQNQNTANTPERLDTNEQNRTTRLGIYKKVIEPELGEITDIKFIFKENSAFLLLVNNEQLVHFINLELSTGNIIKEWKSDLNPYFEPYSPVKSQIHVFREKIEKFFIRNFSIEKDYLIVLSSKDNVHIINPLDGKILWESYLDNKLSTLSVFNNIFYYVKNKELIAREIKTGKLIFSSKTVDMGYDVNPYVFGFIEKSDSVIVGIPVKAGFSLYNIKNGEWIYSVPYNYLAEKVKSFTSNNTPAGSAVTYSYHNGIIYIYWYDQWKPKMITSWLSAFNVLNGELLWNVPIGYNKGKQNFIARKIEVNDEIIKLYDETNIIILKPRR